MSNGQTQDAVVLTGTGANAAFEVGVLQGLRLGTWGEAGNPPIEPFCYSGTSSGALNAAAMVSTAHLAAKEALDRLEDIWLRRIAITATLGPPTDSRGTWRRYYPEKVIQEIRALS